jgi:hypothetical protein
LWTGVTAVLAKHGQTRTLTDFHGLAAFGDEVDRGICGYNGEDRTNRANRTDGSGNVSRRFPLDIVFR